MGSFLMRAQVCGTKLISDKPCELVDENELERHAYNELVEVQKNLEMPHCSKTSQ
jgi:hypothetical protein